MSRIYGDTRQIGYVVADLDQAIEQWVRVGVGPFFRIVGVRTNYFRVRGQDVPLNLDIALAFTGGMQIELIQQTDDSPTPYRDFLLNAGSGMQHLSSWSENYDADVERMRGHGLEQIIDGEVHVDAHNSIRFSYWSPGFEPRTLIEISEATPVAKHLNGIVMAASVDWDGSDPIRAF